MTQPKSDDVVTNSPTTIEQVKKAVWTNGRQHRFVPRSLVGGSGWRIFDRREQRFLTDDECIRIDPQEVWAQ